MKWLVRLAGLGLIAYSASLIISELVVSQQFVRHFFTDIKGPVPFYAINTTLSVFLLWSTGLIFAVCLAATEDRLQSKTERRFYLSQVLLFFALGFDDRFLIHEHLGGILHLNDALIIGAYGIAEIFLLFALGNLRQRTSQTRRYLLAAGLLFGAMVIIDGFFPREMVPRLSLEDLAKTWSTVFLFLFAWGELGQALARLRLEGAHKCRTDG
ncbi:MAG: hypothetical protein JRJ59_03235 [Deltaproteobacteria bacterium]|nr:hypothetical protein [Deltaproteobacteria bacterium]